MCLDKKNVATPQGEVSAHTRNRRVLMLITGLSLVFAVLSLAVGVSSRAELNRLQAYVDEAVQAGVHQASETSDEKVQAAVQKLEEKLRAGEESLTRDVNVRSIAHRGVSDAAPENTLPAFRLAAERGFSSVETDIRFTADGVPVCLHDSSIDRTSDGSGELSGVTFAEVRQYDFGGWKSAEYAGTAIPSFEEFLILCKGLGLHPYIELKEGTTDQIRSLVEMVDRCGMRGKVSWLSFDLDLLSSVRWADDEARLGYLVEGADVSSVHEITPFRSGKNQVFLNAGSCSDALVSACREAALPLELWTVDDEAVLEELSPYVTGVTGNALNYGQFLRRRGMDSP